VTAPTYTIEYPRRRLPRGAMRGLGRLLVPAPTRTRQRGSTISQNTGRSSWPATTRPPWRLSGWSSPRRGRWRCSAPEISPRRLLWMRSPGSTATSLSTSTAAIQETDSRHGQLALRAPHRVQGWSSPGLNTPRRRQDRAPGRAMQVLLPSRHHQDLHQGSASTGYATPAP